MGDLGFSFPFHFSTGEAAMCGDEENIRQSVYIILTTHKGERPMLPDFGTRLSDYAFEPMSSTLLEMMRREIVSSLLKWEERVRQIEVSFGPHPDNGVLHVCVSYQICADGKPAQTELDLPFMGG